MKSTNNEVYDLLFLVDATYSMTDYLKSLQTSLPQIISISTLTNCFSRIGVLAYRDYADPHLLDWSGWASPSSSLSPSLASDSATSSELMMLVKGLVTGAGGDWPEATKTGLAKAYTLMRGSATTIIVHYADAPPHTFGNGRMNDSRSYLRHELDSLAKEGVYGGFGAEFRDWVNVGKMFGRREGGKRGMVFSMLSCGTGNSVFENNAYYNYLTTVTGGACIYLQNSQPASISLVTVELLLSWMGVQKPSSSEDVEFPAFFTRYISIKSIKTLKDESDPAADAFFPTPSFSAKKSPGPRNITKVKLSNRVMRQHLPKKKTPVQDFGKRYTVDEQYIIVAVDELRKLILEDVSAIAINPVFGSLWRAVCKDRANDAREELIASFGRAVDRIDNAKEKEHMKAWLADSYDYTAEVVEIIESVPETQRFPCVCLDPTLVFTREANTHEDDDDEELNKPITSFRRDELLEIARSCDYTILRRLGRVLTRLTYVNSAEEMPEHLAKALDVQRIPMALAKEEHKRQFWRILLHIVVPGTMLSARPAALLAALSIQLGVQPLLEAADREIIIWRDRWNNIEVPETWNVSCLSLLLDSDEAYQSRHGQENSILKTGDRALFERLVSYKMLDLNLDTDLTAEIGWTPEKIKVSIGPVAICRSCNYPRSVTIMDAEDQCGFCISRDYETPKDRMACITANVQKEDNEKSCKAWVECCVRTCRAQYVVYRVEKLSVRAKCHFCREGKVAPVVDCSKCLNRIIWPLRYRPEDFDLKQFECYACSDGRKTIVSVVTTANKVSKENTTQWLLKNNGKLVEPFNKRSLFNTITTLNGGLDHFCDKVELLPATKTLTLNGKLIRNIPGMANELQSWVSRRKTESGTCSLCFNSKRKSDIILACGRTGCAQRICRSCLEGWYGINSVGQIINMAALNCPFCRRGPAPQILSKFGLGIHAVGGLRQAAIDSGAWIHAWCEGCGWAKQYIERVCADGAPPEVQNWNCEGCRWPKNMMRNGKMVRFMVTRSCPGCGVKTEKSSGCDHITCPRPGCGMHWCWHCGKASTYRDIYRHMSEHGGYYGGYSDASDLEDD